MTIDQYGWLAGIYITSITINLSILKIIIDNKLKYPSRYSLGFNTLLSVVGCFFTYKTVGLTQSIGFLIYNSISFLGILYITKSRTVNALELGETLLNLFKTIDLQTINIISDINNRKQTTVKSITRALRYILAEIPGILGLDNTHHSQGCVLVPVKSKFKVVAYESIESYKIELIEKLFNHGSNIVSIAALAMKQRRMIIVNDLADQTNHDAKYWVPTYPEEPKIGSILAYPIIRGLGIPDAKPLAIICITSVKKNAFLNVSTLNRVLGFFAVKIETLQNCLELTNRKK